MRFEVYRFNRAAAPGKLSRRLAICGSLEDACVAALAFAKRLPNNDETVHVSSLPGKGMRDYNLGCVFRDSAESVEEFLQRCRADLEKARRREKEVAKEERARKAAVDARVAWMHGRFPLEVRMRLHDDKAFVDAWCADDFAKAEARAVELGIQPVEVRP